MKQLAFNALNFDLEFNYENVTSYDFFIFQEPIYYAYEYKVHDPLTGDVKGHKELRDGDKVKGYYMLHDADGSMREVHYTADNEVGFTAVVSKTDDVAQPHKPSHYDVAFDHSLAFKKNHRHQIHTSHSHTDSAKHLPSTSFFSQSFENSKNLFNSDSNGFNTGGQSEFHYESDVGARHVEQIHPTPSYEDAYNNFAKNQPMPVVQDDRSSHPIRYSHDEELEDEEDDSLFRDDEIEDFHHPRTRHQYSNSEPFHGKQRNPRINNQREFKAFKSGRLGHSYKSKNNGHHYHSKSLRSPYETYEDDHENDESRPSFSVMSSSKPGQINEKNENTKTVSYSYTSDHTPFVPSISSYSNPPEAGGHTDESSTHQNKVPLKSRFNSKQSFKQEFGKTNIGEVGNNFQQQIYSFRNHNGNSHDSFGFGESPNTERGFKPIANPYASASPESSHFGGGVFKNSPNQNRNPFKHHTSLSPDNSRFRSFKNNSFSSFLSDFDNFNSSPKKFKKGYFEDTERGRSPKYDNKWGNGQINDDYLDDFNGDGPSKHGYQHHPKGFSSGMHSVPKRETMKYRSNKPLGYHSRGHLRSTNKKPRITSIYDVMAYGGSDWPKKIRSTHGNKKSRKVFRRFSNRQYNEGKKKRSVLSLEGYFPDRTTAEQIGNTPQTASLDYEYITNF